MARIRYSYSPTRSGRKHYLGPDEIEVLLSRLPHALWQRLREVHFNDRAWGNRRLGYVNSARRDIAICAIPERVALSRFLVRPALSKALRPSSPQEFGARRGLQWPELAVRRFMLYEVFLHELGHLQVVKPQSRNPRRRFALERRADEFARAWRERLWKCHFDHPDPIHNPPSPAELTVLSSR